MDGCLFCKIVAGEIDCDKVYEDDTVLAFEDINPQMPVHTLVVPKKHYDHIGAEVPEDLLGHLFAVAAKVAADKGLGESGYRLITNIGDDGRQTVKHLHIHVLGGARMPIRMGPAD